MLGLLCLSGANEAVAFGLFPSGDSVGGSQVAQHGDCRKYDDVGHVRKGSLFKRSMHSLLPPPQPLRRNHPLMMFDAMMMEELVN